LILLSVIVSKYSLWDVPAGKSETVELLVAAVVVAVVVVVGGSPHFSLYSAHFTK